MKTISAKIPESDNLLLERLAKGTPGGKSAVVREAISEYCKTQAVSQSKKSEILHRTKGAFRHEPLDARKHRENLSEGML